MQLTASLLGGVVERAAWERAVAESGCAAREWLNSQRSGGTLVFARATDVWRCWITKGEVGRMMQLVVADQRSARDKVRAVVQNFRDQFDQHLYQADRALHGGAADRNPIIARARLALLERVQQASRFARYWLALLDAEPDLNDFRQQRIAALRVAVAKSIAEARDDLSKLGDPPFAAPARRIARRLLDEFAQLLEAGATPRSLRDMQGEPSLDRRLSADLLAAPDIRFDVAGSRSVMHRPPRSCAT